MCMGLLKWIFLTGLRWEGHPPPPPFVYPLGSLVFLRANHCCCCHLLYFMCLLYSSLSAPNAFVCVSSLFYLQIPPCHHKKVRRRSISHMWIPMHFHMDAVGVCCSLHVCVRSHFLLMRLKKKIIVLLTLIWNRVIQCFHYRTICLITKSITHTHWHLD